MKLTRSNLAFVRQVQSLKEHYEISVRVQVVDEIDVLVYVYIGDCLVKSKNLNSLFQLQPVLLRIV